MPFLTSKWTAYFLAFLVLAAIASFTAYEIQKERSENTVFLAHLTNLTRELN